MDDISSTAATQDVDDDDLDEIIANTAPRAAVSEGKRKAKSSGPKQGYVLSHVNMAGIALACMLGIEYDYGMSPSSH